PISSPEHILLSTIIEKSWTEGRDVDLATLIGQVQTPPIRKLGVFEIDAFFPPKDRTKLAMRLNGLVASPSFSSWLQGQPLDIQSLLYTEDGKARASVIYLSHLSDAERQFVVTLVLSKVVSWMRGQKGTSDLRALIYMDEVFGFAPPTAEPPSKKPILTLLKQARAFGVGLLLSTQNPVDLDYKAMSNAGTWMIGRLQTERDKARILEGMKSASGSVDVKMFDQLISDLGKRQFILQSTRATEPAVFTTRWAMSYLAGPLSREQVTTLTEDSPLRSTPPTPVAAPGSPVPPVEAPPAQPPPGPTAQDESPVAPQVPDTTRVYYLDPAAPWATELGANPAGTRLEPALVARVDMVFDDQYADVSHNEEWEAVFYPLGDRFEPDSATTVDYDERDLRTAAPDVCTYALTDAAIGSKSFYASAETDLKEWLYRNRQVEVFKNPALKLYSRVGESQEAFEARCRDAAEDAADEAIAKLKDKYETRIDRVKDQMATAERRVRELETDVQGRRQSEMLSGAGDLLGAILGGRSKSRAIGSAASRRRVTRQTQERLQTAHEKVTDKAGELDDLEDKLADEVTQIMNEWDDAATTVETVEIGLEKTDISVDEVALVWIPV
ncbi:MAG: ATP-binding protein, partial [Acidimicrobiia bacterium]|nr:ATP-binding protein [Acidimicrobiia bacterium]